MFDGKIGVWAFVEETTAKRSSRNRPKGTTLLKNIDSINREVSKTFLIEKVIPAIKAKWPSSAKSKPIYIQQDNARPHIPIDDAEGFRSQPIL